jgi:hypothetical protein
MGLWAWWQQRKAQRDVNKAAEVVFPYSWNRYKDTDCPERDALVNYFVAQRRRIEQATLLWEQGYRHGDHVLVYDAPLGLFTEEVVTKFYDEPTLMPPDMATKFEEAQGTRVRPEDRSQRRFQPDLASHETGLEVFLDNPELAARLEMAVGSKSKKRKDDREMRQQSHLFAHYYSLFVNDPKQYDKEMAELAKKDPRMAADFENMFDNILEAYKSKVEKEIGEMEEELARTYEAIEEGLEELERRKLGQEAKTDSVGEEGEVSK